MDPDEDTSSESPVVERRKRSWVRLGAALLALLALNVLAFWVIGLPAVQEFFQGLEGSVYIGSFLLAFFTNFTVAVPIPYNPIILQMMETTSMPWLVAITTAAGATLGETSGFLAGRAGKGTFEGTKFANWMTKQLSHPVRAFVVLFLISAPPFPAFDVAGVVSGAVGVPAKVFYPAVFLGRLTRFLLFAAFTTWITT
ncbi:MAG: DedA family protein [Actinobacteria bacterium]|nr:DedA family protein [Actinomycetota bacterium]